MLLFLQEQLSKSQTLATLTPGKQYGSKELCMSDYQMTHAPPSLKKNGRVVLHRETHYKRRSVLVVRLAVGLHNKLIAFDGVPWATSVLTQTFIVVQN